MDKEIADMTAAELLDYIMENPNYLSDHYYADFATEIYNRYAQLKMEESEK